MFLSRYGDGRKVKAVYTEGKSTGMRLRAVFPGEVLGLLRRVIYERSRGGSIFSTI